MFFFPFDYSRFGEGPYYVEFTLNFPGQTENKYFTVELASLDDMPASVLTFLQQVHHKLWDNASFVHNAPHVNMARPASNNIDTMFEHNIQHTPFAEYSMEHTPYTLGFAGYPAGPEFYINKEDNTQTHGPNNHREDGHYEPAFATIIIGRDTINDMNDLIENENDTITNETHPWWKRKYTLAEVACTLSHLRAILRAYEDAHESM